MKKQNLLKTLFAETFLGEEVEFIVDMSFKQESASEEGAFTQEAPLAVRGYFLDMDDEYYYLGVIPSEIKKCVKRCRVVGVEIIEEGEEFDQLLNDFPVEGQGN